MPAVSTRSSLLEALAGWLRRPSGPNAQRANEFAPTFIGKSERYF
ncbi:hypothetical protein V2P20_04000 [Methylobacter sp. Wu1]